MCAKIGIILIFILSLVILSAAKNLLRFAKRTMPGVEDSSLRSE